MNKLTALAALLPLCGLLAITPPAPKQNYVPVVVINKTTVPGSQVYFLSHGNDPDGIPCFLKPDVNGVCQYVYPTPTGSPGSAESSVKLSDLPTTTVTGNSDPAYLIYLPVNSSSRGYFSIKHPLYLQTALNPALGVLGINDTSVSSLADPNYYTFYQDFEFGLVNPNANNAVTESFVNLSYVDYFCLPMQLYMLQYPSDETISINYNCIPSGSNGSLTRSALVSNIKTGLANEQAAGQPDSWSSLPINFYANPYDSTDTTASTLRVLAAKNSISLGESPNQFVHAAYPQSYFTPNYASSATYGPQTMSSYYNSVYTYYKTGGNPLYAQIYPKGMPPVVYEIISDAASLVLDFNSQGGTPNYQLNLANLTMEQLLSGATWPFTTSSMPPTTIYTDELSKLVSGLFTIGQFPFTGTTSVGSPFVNSQYNSSMAPGGYYTLAYFVNPLSYSNGPWFNLYDKIVHTQLISKGQFPTTQTAANANFGLAYAYDYDDLLNMAGLIALDIQDQFGNPVVVTGSPSYQDPFEVIVLGSLSGSTIPDISQDTYNFNVTVGSAANGVAVTFLYYDGAMNKVTNASTTTTTSLGEVHVDPDHPFQIQFAFNSQTYTYNINLLRQIVTPVDATSTYSSTDAYFQGSVTFGVTGTYNSSMPGSGLTFTLNYISTPPAWPG